MASQSRAALMRALQLGLGFVLVFSAFNFSQSFVTTLYPAEGFNVLATIYAFYILSSLGAPYLTHRVPLNLIFLACAAVYALFIFAINWGVAALYVTSALVGLAAGAFWVHEGFYITVVSSSFGVDVGKLTSTFLAVFTINCMAGNALPLILMSAGIPMSTILITMGAIALAGGLIMAFLPKPYPAGAEPSAAAAAASQSVSLGAQFRAMGRLATSRPMTDCLALILWNGSLTSLAFGNMPRFLPADVAGSTLVPSMFIAYGFTGTVGSPLWGRAYDRWGTLPLVVGVAVLGVATYALTLVAINAPDAIGRAGWIVAMGALGALDNATNCLINFSLASWFPSGDDTSPAFAVYRLTFCLGFIVLSLLSNLNLWQVILVINIILMVLTVLTFGLRLRRIKREAATDREAGSPAATAAATGADEAVDVADKPQIAV
ncbi:hypothetical protein H9P43_001684 [Blastocladiella emersonii ATCC 22665]|nr:hypothetical protein H9P43_001684 [Blastocladiella emersonii ATCC 22665]